MAADLREARAARWWQPTTELRTGLGAQLGWQGATVGAGSRTG